MSAGNAPRVFVDLAPLALDGSNGGASLFVLRLLEELLRGPGAPELHLLVKPAASAAVASLAGAGAHLRHLGPGLEVEEPRRTARTRRRLPRLVRGVVDIFFPDRASLKRLGADVLFSPLGTAAFHEPGLPHVVIAHDFQELDHPAFFDVRERKRRKAFRADLRRADRVVAVSGATREAAVRKAGVAPGRITVVPPLLGNVRPALPPAELTRRLQALDLAEGTYVVYPANFWPHKNHERLLGAAQRLLASDPSFRLVLCGALEESRERLRELVAARGLAPRVRVLRYLEGADVTALIQGARLLIFPSLSEGFGIPVAEAMALGTPVVCSDLPALREIGGDAAAYFDPFSEAEIAAAIGTLWNDAAARTERTDKGRERAKVVANPDAVAAYRGLLAF